MPPAIRGRRAEVREGAAQALRLFERKEFAAGVRQARALLDRLA